MLTELSGTVIRNAILRKILSRQSCKRVFSMSAPEFGWGSAGSGICALAF